MDLPTLNMAPIDRVSEHQPSKRATLALMDLKDVALARFGDWRVQAAALVAKYHNVVIDPSTTKGYKALCEAIAEVRAPRFSAQNVSKASKSELAKISKAIGAEEEEVIDFLAETERHLVAQKTAYDLKIEQERQAAALAEALRVAMHRDNIAKLRAYVSDAAGKTSTEIASGIATLESLPITDQWEEFFSEADTAKTETMAGLRALFEKTEAAERDARERARIAEEQRIEAARLRSHAEEIARQQAEMAKEAAEAAAVLAAAQKQLADEMAAFRAQQDAARPPTPSDHTDSGIESMASARQEAMQGGEEARAGDIAARREMGVTLSDEPQGTSWAVVGVAVPPTDAAVATSELAHTFMEATTKLGAINARIAPLSITADGLKHLGFTPIGRDRAAVLYRSSDVHAICSALIDHIKAVMHD